MSEREPNCPARCCNISRWVMAAAAELCRLLCCPPVPSRIAAKLAFVPPLPSYEVREIPKQNSNTETEYSFWLDRGSRRRRHAKGMSRVKPCPETDGYSLDVEWLRTANKHYIPALFLRVSGASHTLLFSHGNGADLGQMFEFLSILAQSMHINIFAYEYSGYGASTSSRPGEQYTIWDIEAAWRCLTNKHKVPAEKIVLYGQSVGSGPSCNIASRPEFRPAGVILHSPIMSGLRVLMPLKRSIKVDPYPNIDRIKTVDCPVAIIHGRQDEVVPFYHGVSLHRAISDQRYAFRPLWLDGAGHNNIVGFPEYFAYLEQFLVTLRHDGTTDIFRRFGVGKVGERDSLLGETGNSLRV